MTNTEIIYQEYVRLQVVLNSYANSSFADFQLLGVMGVLLTWEPLSKKLASASNDEVDNDKLLFFGFSGLAFLFFVIATRDLMKQSIVFYYLNEISKYECLVREKLVIKDANLFSASTSFMAWWETTHKYVSLHFRGLTLAFLTFFPVILMWKNTKNMAITYLVIVFLLSLVYLNSARLVMTGSEKVKLIAVSSILCHNKVNLHGHFVMLHSTKSQLFMML